MKTGWIIGGVAAVALLSGVANAQQARPPGPEVQQQIGDCEAQLRSLQDRVTQDERYRIGIGEAAQQVRELRDAARILMQTGHQEACASVVAAMQDIADTQASKVTGSAEEWQARETDRFARAMPVSQLTGPFRADQIIGTGVRNMANEELGEIEDLIVLPDGSAYAIVEREGGFLGMGEDEVAVPLLAFRVAAENDVWLLDLPEDQFAKAPDIDDEDMGADAWKARFDPWYEKQTQQAAQPARAGQQPQGQQPQGGQPQGQQPQGQQPQGQQPQAQQPQQPQQQPQQPQGQQPANR